MATFEHGTSLPAYRIVSANHGWLWLTRSFQLFKPQPGLWIVFTLIFFIIHAMVTSVPYIGALGNILSPILFSGIVAGCLAIERNEELELGYLFAGFRQRTEQLAVIGVAAVIGTLVVTLVAFAPALLVGGTQLFANVVAGDMSSMHNLGVFGGLIVIASLFIFAALMLVLNMTLWFATCLHVLRDVPPVEALKIGLEATYHNLAPLAVYAVLGALLTMLAIIPVGLGLLVMFPLMLISGYTTFQDVFATE
ncbi:putative membrane protein [Chitinivorax tropicus]|uniref:Putative membrane protein n=1 Tax=Chitinivorax tropicus TaxID=714531 RepID=A0A840MJX3_9PROT|nr:BPSS1780 family membrane protein [Chitinivorax tropicus]MBB5017127.1 putative membrane protein [Chitinivorax tropicus]